MGTDRNKFFKNSKCPSGAAYIIAAGFVVKLEVIQESGVEVQCLDKRLNALVVTGAGRTHSETPAISSTQTGGMKSIKCVEELRINHLCDLPKGCQMFVCTKFEYQYFSHKFFPALYILTTEYEQTYET